MKRYYFLLNREYFKGFEHLELTNIAMIQGLLYGMCSIPCNTEMWDVEIVGNFAIFVADCDEEHCKKFMDSIERFYPGINEFIPMLKEES